jgi:citronellol/citronellal dehydrogenase
LRDENQISAAVDHAAKEFGGIDILINNASAINLTPTLQTPAKRFDLMFDVNVRGTFLTSQAVLPHLRESAKAGRNPHILTLSPPLSMKAKWFRNHVAYTMAKYGMSMCVLGMAEEFKREKIAVNALWPRTAIDTAALAMIPGVDTAACRTPEILADAAYIILNRESASCSGNFFVDDEVLASEGITDLEKYSVVPGTTDFLLDFFLD